MVSNVPRPNGQGFTAQDITELANLAASRKRRRDLNEDPDWPAEIERCQKRYFRNYDYMWTKLAGTGRWNDGVRIMRLPVCGREKEFRYVYRSEADHSIPLTTIHAEASNMMKYAELEKQGVFLHMRPPKVWYTKYENDGGRGALDKPGIMCEFFTGAKNAEDVVKSGNPGYGSNAARAQIYKGTEFNVDWGDGRVTPANQEHSLYWSERRRRRWVRQNALMLIQMRLIESPNISGGAENPMYDYMGGFQNLGNRPNFGVLWNFGESHESRSWWDRGRAEEIIERRFRQGQYKNEQEWTVESVRKELAYWSTLPDEQIAQMRNTLHAENNIARRDGHDDENPKIIDHYMARDNIMRYLTAVLAHIDESPFNVKSHRFRDNENQFLGLFPLHHGDMHNGNNIMLRGDTPKFLLDFETTRFKHFAADADIIHDSFDILDPIGDGFWDGDDLLLAPTTQARETRLHREQGRIRPFSATAALLHDQYYRMTVVQKHIDFNNEPPVERALTSIKSARKYKKATFTRFGPSLSHEDFEYGDIYDLSLDAIPRPESPDPTPGMFYDSDSDCSDDLDLQPIYERLRAQRKKEVEESPAFVGTSGDQEEMNAANVARDQRLAYSQFDFDWNHKCVAVLVKRFFEAKIGNQPHLWYRDPAAKPTDLSKPSNSCQLATYLNQDMRRFPQQTQVYFGFDPNLGHRAGSLGKDWTQTFNRYQAMNAEEREDRFTIDEFWAGVMNIGQKYPFSRARRMLFDDLDPVEDEWTPPAVEANIDADDREEWLRQTPAQRFRELLPERAEDEESDDTEADE